MSAEELRQLLDHAYPLYRNKIRYNGIGPRLHGQPNKIWPRDSVNFEDETRKILFALIRADMNPTAVSKIKYVVKYMFDGLRQCNIDSIFNKCCSLGPNQFDGISFEIKHALDAYTSYNQILDLIHSVIRSIDGINKQTAGLRVRYVNTIFGSNRNFDIFKRNLKWLITSSSRESVVHVDNFIHCGEKFMDLDQISWLAEVREVETKYRVYIQVLFSLLRFIFELLRRYFYITLSNPFFDKLFYFRYDLWQKIFDKATKNLIHTGVLSELRLEPDVMSSLPHFATSKLKYHLKKDDVRPICTNHKDSKIYQLDKKFDVILKHILLGTANYRHFSLVDVLVGLRKFKSRQDHGKEIFFVRADIKDCFPSVNQNLLVNIISNRLTHEAEDTNKVKLSKLTCTKVKDNKTVTKYCVDTVAFEQRNPHLNIAQFKDESMSLEEFDQKYLRPCILEPTLRVSKASKIGYVLKQGLRQGSSFSPILSSIYIQTAFNQELDEFLHSDSCRIYRYVDDILFISTNKNEAKLFMHKMLRGFKDYNLTMNLDKLACNFTYKGLDPRLCRLTDYVIFYREQICLKTLTCRYHFNHNYIQLLYTFRVHPTMDRNAIIKSIRRSRWDYIHLDEALNGSELVVVNIFERTLLMAHRAATLIILSFYLCNAQDEELVKELVKKTLRKVWTTIKTGRETSVIQNGLSFQQVRLVVAAAFEATWNLKRVCHRVHERERLRLYKRRALARYLSFEAQTKVPENPNESFSGEFEFEALICKLIREFPTSSFAREVLIPAKDSRF